MGIFHPSPSSDLKHKKVARLMTPTGRSLPDNRALSKDYRYKKMVHYYEWGKVQGSVWLPERKKSCLIGEIANRQSL